MKRATKWLLPQALVMMVLIISFPIVHAQTLALTYDENGNLVSGDGKYRVYDGYNQLRYVYNGTNTSVLLQEYEYHPVEKRVLVKKTYFTNGSLDETVIYFSKQHARVINSSGSFDFTYVYHEGQLIAQVNPDGTKIFIHSDHLGSSTIVTNSTGDIIENTTYTPHGEVLTGGTATRYGYEAKEHDSVVGDTDFNFRKYRADWGIFTQPDNIIQDIYDPQNLNKYSFERGNPLKYKDASGHAYCLVYGCSVEIYILAAVVLIPATVVFWHWLSSSEEQSAMQATFQGTKSVAATYEDYEYYYAGPKDTPIGRLSEAAEKSLNELLDATLDVYGPSHLNNEQNSQDQNRLYSNIIDNQNPTIDEYKAFYASRYKYYFEKKTKSSSNRNTNLPNYYSTGSDRLTSSLMGKSLADVTCNDKGSGSCKSS